LIPFQNTAFSNSFDHICTGSKYPKQNKLQKKIDAVNYFNNNNKIENMILLIYTYEIIIADGASAEI
jgi:hypothetical protein